MTSGRERRREYRRDVRRRKSRVVDLWQFEPAEPDVGIFHSLVIHNCKQQTEDGEEAVEGPTTMADVPEIGCVRISTEFKCPCCGAVTHTTDLQPMAAFEESRDETD